MADCLEVRAISVISRFVPRPSTRRARRRPELSGASAGRRFMFFVVSKALWLLVDPITLLAGLRAPRSARRSPRPARRPRIDVDRRRRAARRQHRARRDVLLLRPLEERFPAPPAHAPRAVRRHRAGGTHRCRRQRRARTDRARGGRRAPDRGRHPRAPVSRSENRLHRRQRPAGRLRSFRSRRGAQPARRARASTPRASRSKSARGTRTKTRASRRRW